MVEVGEVDVVLFMIILCWSVSRVASVVVVVIVVVVVGGVLLRFIESNICGREVVAPDAVVVMGDWEMDEAKVEVEVEEDCRRDCEDAVRWFKRGSRNRDAPLDRNCESFKGFSPSASTLLKVGQSAGNDGFS